MDVYMYGGGPTSTTAALRFGRLTATAPSFPRVLVVCRAVLVLLLHDKVKVSSNHIMLVHTTYTFFVANNS